ncbi:hypothetical protein FSP39_013555 [Pinctada imbricata]|uniref:Uncharacterized protein n=1 Tax=Pinctada imbricata TaxID=66713 RepID=A0AA88YV58_PINIB|nr:hypothetical protein FSP39_013555 [Pinctada imbricata]
MGSLFGLFRIQSYFPLVQESDVKESSHNCSPIRRNREEEEEEELERTKKVYSMYSRKPAEEVKQTFIDLKVDYVILEDSWCTRRSKPGCGMAEIWDIEDEKNRNVETPLCTRLRKNPSPQFSRVFRNEVYDVLKVSKW